MGDRRWSMRTAVSTILHDLVFSDDDGLQRLENWRPMRLVALILSYGLESCRSRAAADVQKCTPKAESAAKYG